LAATLNCVISSPALTVEIAFFKVRW